MESYPERTGVPWLWLRYLSAVTVRAAVDEPPRAVIVDLDGTLCDVRSIRHFVEEPLSDAPFRRDFEAFHSASLECPSFPAVVDLLHELRSEGLLILVVSAREARWAFLSALWLEEQGVAYDEMFLRINGDHRPDVEIKHEIAKEVLRRFRPHLAIDDRDDIIEVWRSFGIPALKVLSDGTISGTNSRGAASAGDGAAQCPGGGCR